MNPQTYPLNDGTLLLIREATPEDAAPLLNYVHVVCGESDFLTFGPGEFELTVAQEEAYLSGSLVPNNQIYILGLIEGTIVAALNFSGGRRPRVRHSGEFGMSVRKEEWGRGIGSLMVDTLIAWAKEGGIVRKIDLRVRTDNERAILLYERKGFVREGTLRRQMFLDEEYYDLYAMGLEL